MPISRNTAIAIIAVLGALLVFRIATADERPSRIIYPEQRLPLRFSHAQHMGTVKMSCETCHTGIRTSASSLDNNLPQEADCVSCHAIDRTKPEKTTAGPAAACVRCHPSYDASQGRIERVLLPIPNLKFSHQGHLARGDSCETCHGDFSAVEEASAEHLPSMRTCQGCHDGKKANDVCTTCHLAQAGLLMQSEFPGVGTLSPSGSLRGARHDMEFRTSHKYAAQNDSEFCASCHRKDFCQDCHNGIQKPMDFHAGDYVRIHSMDARRNSPDCSSCHRLQTFCQGCHSRMGVADDEKGGQFRGTGAYHPEGWNGGGLAGRSANHHAFEAQRNIKQCASCHREHFCISCHSAETGGIRANPHPRDWRGSRRCRALVKRSRRMCLRCHVDPAIGC
ncbi:MAG: cytochrome c3 family protein [Myxococcales bacterium]|nr:cytochrome c3 family protein [Myxococcales bacterium]